MSGIVGIFNLDGAPVDRSLLRRMTEHMAFRGPDAQETWIDGNVGFGHTMFRTTFEAANERQPLSFDGDVWLTADARVDARAELIGKLESHGRDVCSQTPDADLILHAYHVWREDCVHHLIGDFAFAIWDKPRRRLFCARDHFGVRPFFYAQVGSDFVFCNTLNSLRLYPGITNQLYDPAVADFLLFTRNAQFDRTIFADIRKLPPAHTLVISSTGSVSPRRYWSLPQDTRIQYRRAGEYVDHFKELFRASVSDRLRTDRVSILMSGGLDSSSIAATAIQLGSAKLHAHTMTYDRIMPDRERYYSGLVARHLGIPIEYQVLDDYKLYERWDDPSFWRPEPVHNPLDAIGRDLYARAASTARVALNGVGGDPAFLASGSYLRTLLKSGRLLTVVRSTAHIWQTTHRLPRIGVRTLLKSAVGVPPEKDTLPGWLNPHFCAELDLRSRFTDYWAMKYEGHPRAEALDSLGDAYWGWCFEQDDSGVVQEKVEPRYPFFDRRVLEFVVSIPPIPWCVEKYMLRVAMEGLLPEEIRIRKKTPLVSDGMTDRGRQAAEGWENWSKPVPELARFVDLGKLPGSPPRAARELDNALLPLSLNWWLRHLRGQETIEGESDEQGTTRRYHTQAV